MSQKKNKSGGASYPTQLANNPSHQLANNQSIHHNHHIQLDQNFHHNLPPPTYEQSQMQNFLNGRYSCAPPVACFNTNTNANSFNPQMNSGCGHASMQQLDVPMISPPSYDQRLGYNYQAGYSSQYAKAPVVEFAAGSRFYGGPVTIPLPPPGCLPTPGQLAAMNGQKVRIEKRKQSLF